MGMTTMGVKLDEGTRDRLKVAAQQIDRTPHWLIKQAIFSYLERLESGDAICLKFPLAAERHSA
jgi:RHH-type transcriptional regulator, proline utilization regulon repressor / proline dehydrogenase / delta 1-pyrroline-5-carboxylate dehydrogenase